MAQKIIQLNRIKNIKHLKFLIILIAIVAYIVWIIVQFNADKKVTPYEVREGSIVMDTAFTGFAIRNEKVVKSDGDGYINFFVADTDKVGVNNDVYTLSSSPLKYSYTSDPDEKVDDNDKDNSTGLTTEEQNSIALKIQDFDKNFNPSDFSGFYSLRNSISENIAEKSNQTKKSQLKSLASENDDVHIYKSDKDGFLVYELDGYEDVNVDNFNVSVMEKGSASSKTIEDNTKIKKGDSIYKIISDDYWTLVIQLPDDMAKDLSDEMAEKEVKTMTVTVKFAKDNQKAKAVLSISEMNNTSYGFLKFDNSVLRYAEDRYIDIELMLEDQSGLKIPQSAIVEKTFYTVPLSYITEGGGSKSEGVMVDNGTDTSEFKATTVYYKDEVNGLAYIDSNLFKEGTVICKPKSHDEYHLVKMKKLKGVYNINKGYAVFKQVQILAESDEYCIVQEGYDDGLANYDHIALDSSVLKENDILYQ